MRKKLITSLIVIGIFGAVVAYGQNQGGPVYFPAEEITVGNLIATTIDFDDGSTQKTAYRSQTTLPQTEIPAGDTATVRFQVPSGKTMNIIRLGIQSDTGSSLTNLEIDVDTDSDDSNGTTETTTATSTTSSATISAGSNAVIRMDNNRSDTKTVSAFVEYRYE